MPKTNKSSKARKHPRMKYNNIQMTSNSLHDLINTISNNRSKLTKTETNLPAKLMSMNFSQPNQHSKIETANYSRSVSSTYSSSMHNGKFHTVGKEVINNSRNPFIQVKEIHDGYQEEYIIPKNSKPSKYQTSKKTKKQKKN